MGTQAERGVIQIWSELMHLQPKSDSTVPGLPSRNSLGSFEPWKTLAPRCHAASLVVNRISFSGCRVWPRADESKRQAWEVMPTNWPARSSIHRQRFSQARKFEELILEESLGSRARPTTEPRGMKATSHESDVCIFKHAPTIFLACHMRSVMCTSRRRAYRLRTMTATRQRGNRIDV